MIFAVASKPFLARGVYGMVREAPKGQMYHAGFSDFPDSRSGGKIASDPYA